MTAIEFLRRYRPGSLVKSSARGEYQLAEHDSFKINGESSVWHWKSRDIGGKSALKYLIYVCLQGVVIALSCIIFSAISSSPPAVDTGASVVTAVWTYVGELAFNLLVLVGAIKGCDRIVKEIMGL